MTRTITTATELDALPVGSVVLTARNTVWRRMDDSEDAYRFESPEVKGRYQAATFESAGDLPATVLHDPSGPVIPAVSDATVPSATREGVADAFYEQYLVTSMADGLILADALLDRFNVTLKEDR